MTIRRAPLLAAIAAGALRATLAGALLALLAGAAHAAPATARLETTAAGAARDCPDAAALAAIVNDGLGRAAIAPAHGEDPAAMHVAVTFDRAPKGYAATVRIDGAHAGTRKLANEGPGCGALANAVGVLLVLLLDSDDGVTAGLAPPAGPASPESPVTAARAPGSTTGELVVGGGVAEGLVGGASPALGLGGTLGYQRWSARLGGLWFLSKTSDYSVGRVDVGLATARLALCASLFGDRTRWTLGLCAQQQVGWMRVRGIDYSVNRTADQLWLATGASIVAAGALGRSLGWEIEAGAVRVLQQHRFVIDNLGTAFETEPFAFMTTFAFTTRVW